MKGFKSFSVLVVAILVLGMVAACGGTSKPAPATSAPAGQAAPEAAQATEAPKPTEAAAPAAAAGQKFVFASDASFPPMEFVDQSKAIVGFDMDLIQAIAKDQKFTAEVKNTAWDGIFAGLESGQYDAIISSVTMTPERARKVRLLRPVLRRQPGHRRAGPTPRTSRRVTT